MLIRREDLKGIVAGQVDLAFRRWKRPTVKTGGTLRTAVGVLSILEVREVSESDLTEADARRAGYASLGLLVDQLSRRSGSIYRVELNWLGEDPRVELRKQSSLTEVEVEELRARLARYDKASRQGPWSAQTLDLIQKNPEVRAADLVEQTAWEKAWFKTNVRKLKNLGLTESLKRGYRLSPRGAAFLEAAD